MPGIRKILIANRGEIALRVMRTAREMGITTVAVYSDADRAAPHVAFADEAVHIGPATAAQSYLHQGKIIDAAKKTSADAIHPGYGFLSENDGFAEMVEKAGIAFIGPSSNSIRIMGNKLTAKQAVQKFDVPLVPGTAAPVRDANEGIKIAKDIGYPILIKASAGGGGKGMRIVEKEKDLKDQMERAVREAESAFGNGDVFIEKYVKGPRHIEFQILGDMKGNIVHLFERECSIQRRHQKVIEEAPSSVLTAELRNAMGEAAVNVARSCNYWSAGTVEFIFDEQRNFYFLEMNTRLQVEHPVTEMITGLDLVRLQIQIAEGKTLPFAQEDIRISGHAVESRIYAEDPYNQFLPDTGTLLAYRQPDGNGIRVDGGIEEGMVIPYFYDPMIAKLVTHAETRELAITKMTRALDEYVVTGVQTTIPFCRFVMEHEAFRTGKFNTHFVEKYFSPQTLNGVGHEDEELVASLLAVHLFNKNGTTESASPTRHPTAGKWKRNRRD